MPALDQVIGIIDIDAEPRRASRTDDTLGDTLLLLRTAAADQHVPADACHLRRWQDVDPGDRQALRADLAQLASDLECEYRRLRTSISAASVQ